MNSKARRSSLLATSSPDAPPRPAYYPLVWTGIWGCRIQRVILSCWTLTLQNYVTKLEHHGKRRKADKQQRLHMYWTQI